jgi:short-chain Z-isoprenyl diphosphate synthase
LRLQPAAPIYRIYERRLLRQVLAGPMPKHIGLVLDGNRRYGRHHNLIDPHEIYMAGANKLDELLDWCTEVKVQSARDIVRLLAGLDRTIRSRRQLKWEAEEGPAEAKRRR